MISAVDTNVLLALLAGDDYADASATELRRAYRRGRVVVTPIVYAELAVDGSFESASDLDRFLEDLSIGVEEPSREALFRAGEAFRRYTERRPDGFQCPSCGAKRTVTCRECGVDLAPRQHVAADFLVGGHAAADANVLLSFDGGIYGTYFPSLTVRPR